MALDLPSEGLSATSMVSSFFLNNADRNAPVSFDGTINEVILKKKLFS